MVLASSVTTYAIALIINVCYRLFAFLISAVAGPTTASGDIVLGPVPKYRLIRSVIDFRNAIDDAVMEPYLQRIDRIRSGTEIPIELEAASAPAGTGLEPEAAMPTQTKEKT
ncbi:MAG: hypothetical protein WCT32_00075 [Patescibacteria group bacterium]|jgi:hypothetical protein